MITERLMGSGILSIGGKEIGKVRKIRMTLLDDSPTFTRRTGLPILIVCMNLKTGKTASIPEPYQTRYFDAKPRVQRRMVKIAKLIAGMK